MNGLIENFSVIKIKASLEEVLENENALLRVFFERKAEFSTGVISLSVS